MPGSPVAETYLGVIAIQRNDLPAAREHFSQSLALQPGFAMAAIDLAQSYRLEKRTDDARAVFDRFLQQEPSNMTILMARAELEVADGKGDTALAFLERARSSDPHALQPRLELVAAYIQRNDSARALEIGREVEAMAPRDSRAVAALAEAQLASNNRETAIHTFDRLVSMTDGAPDPLIRLADVLASGGDVPGGYRAMRRALDGNPVDRAWQQAFFAFSGEGRHRSAPASTSSASSSCAVPTMPISTSCSAGSTRTIAVSSALPSPIRPVSPRARRPISSLGSRDPRQRARARRRRLRP